jgi:hypothetical protein
VLSSFVTKFRQRYPKGSLLSELLTIHDGLFVVRSAVVVDGSPLAQGLAAHQTLETAEDQACQRALERMGLSDLSPVNGHLLPVVGAEQPSNDSMLTAQQPQPTGAVEAAPPQSPQPDVFPPTEDGTEAPSPTELKLIPAQPSEPKPKWELPELPVLKQDSSPQTPSLATPPGARKPKPEEVKPSNPESSSASGHSLDMPTTAPIDLSDIIAQTGVELQRLGWDVHKGREFLEKTYGKRSRHDLTDEELLEFLLYLETQTPEQS